MADISAKQVAELRAKTGCGMMECKKALVENNGDMEASIKYLRERGLSVAAKKADRIAADGIVDIMINENGSGSSVAAMIEVNSETDFVAKNASFKEFVRDLLSVIIKERPADAAALMDCKFDSDMSVSDKLKEMIFTIGENMNIRRFAVTEGILSTYIHGGGTIGVIVNFEVADPAVTSRPEFTEFAKNIALQVGAYPVFYLNKDTVPASVIEEEKQILITQIKNDPANAKKSDNIIEKMVIGRIGKFYEANCLCEQSYVKDDSMTIEKYVAETVRVLGCDIKVTGFHRFEKGEGIQKREENFGDEISKMINN